MKKYLSRFFAAMMAIASIGIAVAQTEGAGAGSGAVPGAAKPVQQRKNDAIGDLIQSFNPTGGPPIRF